MASLETWVFALGGDGDGKGGDHEVNPPGTPSQARRGTLLYGRVLELVTCLMRRRFYGKLALHFEAGQIVCAKLEQTIKE